MAKVGVFQRLGNLWRGFVSLWISDVEKKHPEIAYENAINSMVEKYTQLKRATAAILRRRDDVSARLTARRAELAQVEADLDTAVQTDQQELGLILVQKQKSLHASAGELAAELEQAVGDADSAKASLLQVQAEIRKLKAEKDNMLAKMASAEARVRVQEQLDGLSVDAEVKALDNVRTHIKETIAQARLGQELAESDVDARLKALRQRSGDVTAKAEWERLRGASAARQAAAKKTM
jgi:phage shock protein A